MRGGYIERGDPGAKAALLPAPPTPQPPTGTPAHRPFPPQDRELLASAGAGVGDFRHLRPGGQSGKERPGLSPRLRGREACRGRSPAGSSGRVGEKREPESPPSPQPLPLSVPPGPHRVSAARTGPPPSGSPRAQSLTQHDGLGAAAARTAVPAGHGFD